MHEELFRSSKIFSFPRLSCEDFWHNVCDITNTFKIKEVMDAFIFHKTWELGQYMPSAEEREPGT